MAAADSIIPETERSQSQADAEHFSAVRTSATSISMFDQLVANRRVQQLGDLLLMYAIFTQLITVTTALDQSWNEPSGVFSQQSQPSITPLLLSGLTTPATILILVFIIHTNRWTTLRKSATILSSLGVAVGAVARLNVPEYGRFSNKLSAIGLFVLACMLAALLATSVNENELPDPHTQDAEHTRDTWNDEASTRGV